ncbi:MAG: hypothetical protein HC790_07600 [Acaryochloridaceae cyanobacterium CSU_3_4]|nr:hypothetical protein [Acaryochloridaceae cyanobacterium CSU_3_4]
MMILLTACSHKAVQPPTTLPVTPQEPTPQTPVATGASSGAGVPVPTTIPPNPTTPLVSPSLPSSCNYFAGNAVGGQTIYVDVCSIRSEEPTNIRFIYYLGRERVEGSANCPDFNWISYPEAQVHTPQSEATENMLNKVCQG